MTSWLQDLLRTHPEIAFFLVLGIGYLIGRIALGGFKIGAGHGPVHHFHRWWAEKSD